MQVQASGSTLLSWTSGALGLPCCCPCQQRSSRQSLYQRDGRFRFCLSSICCTNMLGACSSAWQVHLNHGSAICCAGHQPPTARGHTQVVEARQAKQRQRRQLALVLRAPG